MELQITIDWHNVKDAVVKHLSYIGNRLEDKSGNTMFGKITMSSEEEMLLQQYVNAAAETFVGELAPLVSYYNSGDFLVFVVSNSRWAKDANGINVPFEGNFMGYVVSYVTNSVLGMNYPELAKKYETDMQRHILAAQNLVFIKQPPTVSSAKYEDVKGECEIDEDETKIGY